MTLRCDTRRINFKSSYHLSFFLFISFSRIGLVQSFKIDRILWLSVILINNHTLIHLNESRISYKKSNAKNSKKKKKK